MSKYPKDFLWGASTASHQVEGGTHNQWSEWEKANAERLAAIAPKDLGWLPKFTELRPQLTDPANYISGNGVEHYMRYEQDFDIIKSLHMNAFRFGIEWARLEPRQGEWDEAAVQHYHDYIAALKARGIEPILNIWHWTMPVWFTDEGGFEKRRNLVHFERFVTKIAEEFGSSVRYVLTLNEPNVYTLFSYATGWWPPQRKNPVTTLRVYRNLVHAHRRSYQILKQSNPSLAVGLAAQLGDMQPANRKNPVNLLLVKTFLYVWNWWFLNRIRKYLDFIGINYYFTEYRDGLGRSRNPSQPMSDLGWYMEPSGIYAVLTGAWRRYQKPIIIVENGLADAHDEHREWWLRETFTAMERALSEGVDLRGYLHWSLLDNFEWAFGWWPKFGLVDVDRKTMQRTVRPSAWWFSKQIHRHRQNSDS